MKKQLSTNSTQTIYNQSITKTIIVKNHHFLFKLAQKKGACN